ncbi:hypothetical protein [Fulvivirga sp.]|uniref:cytidylyltransferase domain-containing protein n=1 Tax=Fulvivirga sp. TaxID=1931237 RepID=UPI0032EF7F02
MKIGAVILSRYSSSRLPGKALMKIQGKAVLEYIVERLLLVFNKKDIVIATSQLESDNLIASFAESHGLNCFRGSLENVAERFFQAAQSLSFDYATRINGDNIFADVNVIRDMVKITQNNNYSFISNVKDRTFPKGMSVEIVKMSHYKSLMPKINCSEEYKEHVTLYLYDHVLEDYYFFYNRTFPEAAGIQMALDSNDDLDRAKNIIVKFNKPHWHYNMQEVFQIMKEYKYE